ncbi:hypothetical protein B566_EDAN004243 [Ephemera danica]|nr:hypothetical protein B566_EDAN004243 [Ephemera danica]
MSSVQKEDKIRATRRSPDIVAGLIEPARAAPILVSRVRCRVECLSHVPAGVSASMLQRQDGGTSALATAECGLHVVMASLLITSPHISHHQQAEILALKSLCDSIIGAAKVLDLRVIAGCRLLEKRYRLCGSLLQMFIKSWRGEEDERSLLAVSCCKVHYHLAVTSREHRSSPRRRRIH